MSVQKEIKLILVLIKSAQLKKKLLIRYKLKKKLFPFFKTLVRKGILWKFIVEGKFVILFLKNLVLKKHITKYKYLVSYGSRELVSNYNSSFFDLFLTNQGVKLGVDLDSKTGGIFLGKI